MSYPSRHKTPSRTEREIIGDRIARGRGFTGKGQEAFAAAMTVRTGRKWTRQKISEIERGRSPVPAEDLRAIAQEQGLAYAWYLDGELVSTRAKPDLVSRDAKILPFRKRDVRPIDPTSTIGEPVPA